jgi:hypothetical protein
MRLSLSRACSPVSVLPRFSVPSPACGGSRHCREAEGWSGWGFVIRRTTHPRTPTPSLPRLRGREPHERGSEPRNDAGHHHHG